MKVFCVLFVLAFGFAIGLAGVFFFAYLGTDGPEWVTNLGYYEDHHWVNAPCVVAAIAWPIFCAVATGILLNAILYPENWKCKE